MTIPRLLIALAVANLGLLVLLLEQIRPAEAGGVTAVLRGRALEIVDDQGRVRASIQVQRADPAVRMPNGKTSPENVILRLIDPHERPAVKLGASEQGSGLGLVGESDATDVVLKAEGTQSSLQLTTADGRQQLVKP